MEKLAVQIDDQPGHSVRLFRSRLLQTTYGAAMATAVLILGLIAAFAVPDPWTALMAFATVVAVPIVIYRSFRIALLVEADGVVIRNFIRTYRLNWQELGRVGVGVESVGSTFLPAVAFYRRGERKALTSQASTRGRKERDAILDAIRPYAQRWGIEMSA